MRAQANEKTEGVARPISRHQDLHVYQYAFDAAFAIFELTKRFPREEERDGRELRRGWGAMHTTTKKMVPNHREFARAIPAPPARGHRCARQP